MKISVVIPTRNRAQSLARCLESLAGQRLPPHEVIVVDNASADRTVRVASEFSGMLAVKYVYEALPDVARARNRGIEHATGDVVAFIDDDCTADPDWTEVLSRLHGETGGLVVGGVARNGYPGVLLCRLWQTVYGLWFNAVNRLDGGGCAFELPAVACPVKTLMTNNVSYARDVLRRAGRFMPGAGMNEDAEFHYRLSGLGVRVLFDPRLGVTHYYRNTFAAMARALFVSGRGVHRIRRGGAIRNSVLELGWRGRARFVCNLLRLPGRLAGLGLWTDAAAVLPFFAAKELITLAGYATEGFGACLRPQPAGDAGEPV